jgi:hypothetical protein
MSDWKVSIGYLPQDIADEAKHVVFDQIDDDSTQYSVMRLIERAFSQGYQTGFMRSHWDESWKQFKVGERAKKAAKESVPQAERSDPEGEQ